MRSPRYAILLSVVLSCLSGLNLRAGDLTIRGTIIPAPGETLLPNHIVVTLNGSGLHEAILCANGSFTFSNLPSGVYQLAITAPGRQSASTTVEISESAACSPVLLALGPPVKDSEPSAPGGGAVVHVKELRVTRKAREAYEQGVRYLNEDQAGKAEKHLQMAISRHPDYYHAHFALGVVYTKLGQLKQAQDQFARAVEIDPNEKSAQRNLGVVLLLQKEPASAIAPLLEATRLDPSDPRSFDYLGQAYFQAQRPDEARQSFEKCLVLNPTHHLATFRLGEISAQSRDYAQALAYFKRMLTQNPPPHLAAAAESNIEELQARDRVLTTSSTKP